MLLNVFFLVKFSARLPYNLVLNYAHSSRIKDGESYTMPLGLRLCLRIEWAHTEIFPKLPEVSHNNTVFTVEYYGHDC